MWLLSPRQCCDVSTRGVKKLPVNVLTCVARCGVARTVNTCLTLFELFGDVLVSWAPLYYEAKILFVLFLTIPNFRVRALT